MNLDAMIPRADFAVLGAGDTHSSARIHSLSLRDFQDSSPLLPNLRKPDFQRETNHWTAAQVHAFIKSFVDGDLIPSVILWSSTTSIFVIDGGHRLSVLRSWVLDDYGDGPLSHQYFGREFSDAQRRAAREAQKLIDNDIGSWRHWMNKNQQPDLPEAERIKAKRLSGQSQSSGLKGMQNGLKHRSS